MEVTILYGSELMCFFFIWGGGGGICESSVLVGIFLLMQKKNWGITKAKAKGERRKAKENLVALMGCRYEVR